MKIAILYFKNVHLRPSVIHKLRGYVGNLFKNQDLIHNHDIDTGKPIYRYPRIQFKLIDKTPAIFALTETGVKAFGEIFMSLEDIVIDGISIPVMEKDLKIGNCDFGFSEETFMYEFHSPWMGLNQKNFKIYTGLRNKQEKKELLKRVLVGNILSMSKYLGLHLSPDQRICADLQLEQVRINLKGKQMIGFTGIFKTNFMIPDYAGLGKSVSRGLGTVKKIL